MKPEQIQEMLAEHGKWVINSNKGERANFCGADLQGVYLCGVNLSMAYLRMADLSMADLRGTNLYGADLYRANLSGADLYRANFRGVTLRGATLSGADFRGANFYGADLSGADLRGTDLSGADNIVSFGPIGEHKRIGYIVNGSTIKVQLGCHFSDVPSTLAKLRNKYGSNSMYYKTVELLSLTKWEQVGDYK